MSCSCIALLGAAGEAAWAARTGEATRGGAQCRPRTPTRVERRLDNVSQYQPMSANVGQCRLLSADIGRFQPVSAKNGQGSSGKCRGCANQTMSVNVGQCWPTSANCQPMSAIVDPCPQGADRLMSANVAYLAASGSVVEVFRSIWELLELGSFCQLLMDSGSFLGPLEALWEFLRASSGALSANVGSGMGPSSGLISVMPDLMSSPMCRFCMVLLDPHRVRCRLCQARCRYQCAGFVGHTSGMILVMSDPVSVQCVGHFRRCRT